jgi:hypothetical protein
MTMTEPMTSTWSVPASLARWRVTGKLDRMSTKFRAACVALTAFLIVDPGAVRYYREIGIPIPEHTN